MKRTKYLAALAFACQPDPILPPPTASITAKETFEVLSDGLQDVLFVIDDSGSMRDEQHHILKELALFIERTQVFGLPNRFATVTTNTRGAANQNGDFFTRPINALGEVSATRDIKDKDGVILDVPDEFCDEVLARSENGVLSLSNGPLFGLLNEDNFVGDLDLATPGVQILDFMGRDPATTFIDADGDPLGRTERASQIITATLTDAVGCILAVGVEGSSFEAGLCKVAAALDEDSLAGNNSAFLRDPNAELMVVMVGDEDDCTLSMTTGSTVTCGVPDGDEAGVDEAASAFCTQPVSTDVCLTGVDGVLNELVPAEQLAQALLGVKIDPLLRIASLAGPPKLPSLQCVGGPSISPSCQSGGIAAAPGNREQLFTDEFSSTIDSFSETGQDVPGHLAEGICGGFGAPLADSLSSTAALLNTGCFNSPVADDFDDERDMRVTVDLTKAQKTCEDIVVNASFFGTSGAQDGDPVMLPLNKAHTLCEIRHDPTDGVDFFDLENVGTAVCQGGFQLGFVDFRLPAFSLVTIEYVVSLPQ